MDKNVFMVENQPNFVQIYWILLISIEIEGIFNTCLPISQEGPMRICQVLIRTNC
jgi:hypothetical protein